MRHVTGTRSLALIAGLLFAGTGSALAQDTTGAGRATMDTTAPTGAIDTSGVDSTAARDTTDTSVTNPPGYRGMERDTTMSGGFGRRAGLSGHVVERRRGRHGRQHGGRADRIAAADQRDAADRSVGERW